jgi:cytoskeleton protein RodZ
LPLAASAGAPNAPAVEPAAPATSAAVVVPAASAVAAPIAPPPGKEGASAAAAASATAAQGVDEVLAHVAPPNIPLQVIASADSWVEVVDAQGHSLLSRTVVAGESVGLDGALPMRVKIGNARATRIKLRGDNVDLAPWTRDNVARLELK